MLKRTASSLNQPLLPSRPRRIRDSMEQSQEMPATVANGVGLPVPGSKLQEHVRKLGHRNETGHTGFEEEYFVLDKRSDNYFFGDFQEALKHVNRSKNRYTNVLPLDRTRVVLSATDEPGADYINANYVDGVYEKQYIATQGPLKETAEDFWRMCWEQDVNVIVMLTRVTENSRIKCYKYWPAESKSKRFGLFSVKLVNKDKEHGLCSRLIHLIKHGETDEEREIAHFQYKDWPDHGLPSSAATFRHLLHLVDSCHDRRGPILVHCSAGIGRTGTFCAVHTITQNLDRHHHEHLNGEPEPEFNVFDTILKLRLNRVGMVQTRDQFEFCHQAVLEEYLAAEKRRKERLQEEGKDSELE